MLDAPSPAACARWVQRAWAGEAIVLPSGVLLPPGGRAHRPLRQLFGTEPKALDWLRTPHDALPFSGQPPQALMTGGSREDLDAICRYLAALAQGHPAAPGPADLVLPADRPGREP